MMIENLADVDYQFYPTPKDLCLYIRDNYILKLDSEYAQSCFTKFGRSYNKHTNITTVELEYGKSQYIDMMLSNKAVLDPSAGKGDLINGIFCSHDASKDRYPNHYAIEIDPNLRSILFDRKFKLLSTNFFNYSGDDKFDYIIMNPPFKDGDRHLLHAIQVAKRYGSKIICILNANTLKNPYSVYRDDLLKQIELYNGSIEYLESTFSDAERKTNVEIAIVYIEVPEPLFNEAYDDTLNNLKHDDEFTINQGSDVVTSQEKIKQHIGSLLQSYNTKKQFSLDLIELYVRNSSLTEIRLQLTYPNSELYDYNIKSYSDFIKDVIDRLKIEHWERTFYLPEFTRYMTSKDKDRFMDYIKSISTLEFSMENIQAILDDVRKFFYKSIEIAIDDLFDDITNSNYYPEQKKNVHMYSGWKTNNGYKINKKFILAINVYGGGFGRSAGSGALSRIADIQKVLTHFNGNKQPSECVRKLVDETFSLGQTKVENDIMTVQYFKKGTTHITIKDEKIINRYNQYIGKRRQWLPPEYGNTAYTDLSPEVQALVNEYEGVDSYSENLNDPLAIDNLSNSMLLLN